jgi:hypothetical protein
MQSVNILSWVIKLQISLKESLNFFRSRSRSAAMAFSAIPARAGGLVAEDHHARFLEEDPPQGFIAEVPEEASSFVLYP